MSSFKRNPNLGKKPDQPSSSSACPIGFHPSHYNGVQITSTGITSLDDLLGGGLPIASSFLLLEDHDGTYAKLILRYSMAQAIASNQNLIVVGSSFDESGDPEKIIHRLMSLDESYSSSDPISSSQQAPEGSSDSGVSTGKSGEDEEDDDDDETNNSKSQRMKIAWRYENAQQHHAELDRINHQSRCHSFNLSKTMKLSTEQLTKIDCIDVKNLENLPMELLSKIKNIIEAKQDPLASFRIVIQSIGSIGWPPIPDYRIFQFFKELDVLLRDNVTAKVAIVSFPSIYRSPELSQILPWATSGSMSLQSFAGNDRSQSAFPNHQGSVHFIRLPSPSSLSSPATKLSTIRALGGASEAGIDGNLGFKLGRRKGFQIEMMGLGLDIDNNDEEELEIPPQPEETSELNLDEQVHISNTIRADSSIQNKKPSSLRSKLKVRFGNTSQDSSHLKNTDW